MLLLLFVLLGLWVTSPRAQCTQDFDLTEFDVAGPLGNGIWETDASSAQQLVNGKPTFLVSPKEMINVRITGSLRVDSLGDDNDYIGFVFGVQEPTTYTNSQTSMDLWLLDWKAIGQNSAEEGFSLIKIQDSFDFDDPITFMPYFWTHNTYSGFEIAQENYGDGLGWATNTTYDVEITLLYNRTTIKINGETIMDRFDCFDPGRFGFYSFSQEGVRFENFSCELIPDFVVPESACRNEDVRFFYSDGNCSAPDILVNNVVSQVSWDFGDNGTSTLMNPTHEYPEPGPFLVTMTVTDDQGCQESVSHFFEVLNGPTADFSVQDACIGAPVEFENLSNSNGLNILSTQWDIDSDGNIDYTTPEIDHAYQENGTYTATLIVNGTVCSDTISRDLTLFPAPEAIFEVEQLGTSRTVTTVNLSEIEDNDFLWDFNDPNTQDDTSNEVNPSYTYSQDGEYDIELVVSNSGGCTDTLIVKRFVNFQDNTFIPTAFTPNGDGQNDRFRLLGTTLYDIDMRIYNEWGELVFNGSDQSLGWDGTVKGQQGEPGNYTYIIQGADAAGEKILYKGVVALIR